MTFGEAPDGPVENLFARRGTKGPHLAFAGHTDVVPAGHGWTREPFAGEIAGGMLHGRGAVDMKGAIAAFAAAADRVRGRSEEHTSELQSLMRISYADFCLTKKTKEKNIQQIPIKISEIK